MQPQNPIYAILTSASIKKGMNASQLAQEVGVRQSTVSRWLKGLSEPSFQYWEALEKALELEEDTILKAKQAMIQEEVNERKKRRVRPEDVAAFGELKYEDREQVADLLHQVLERLDEQRQMIAEIQDKQEGL